MASFSLISRATSPQDIIFPIVELGGCNSEAECRIYCDQRDSADIIRACLAFAKKHNLLPADVIARGEKFADVAAGGGPGECKDEKTCVAYCENIAHIQECVSFVEKYDLLPEDELTEIKNIASALKAGAKLPGDCTGKENCLAYCENPAHIDECLAFAEKAGFISGEELAEAKKVAPFLKRGETPGGCKSKAECEAYCGYPDHVDECISFAEKLGLMSAREAELIKKAAGKSPGDCARGSRNPEEAQVKCVAFCNKEENRQTCFKFAVEMGLMTVEEASQIGLYSDFQACYAITTPKIRQCIDKNLGQDVLKKLLKGQMAFRLDELEEMMAKIRNARDCTNRYADAQLQTFTDDPDALACLDSELGKDFIDRIKSGRVACGDASIFQKKIADCMGGKLGKKLDQCFNLGCSEMKTCIQKFQKQSDEPIGEEPIDIDPSWKDKISTELNACVVEDIRSCLAKDCSEMLVCIDKHGEAPKGGAMLDSSLEAEITVKVAACAKQGAALPLGGQSQTPEYKAPQYQAPEYPQYPQAPGGSTYEIPVTPELCANFASVPVCSYAGPSDSQNYQLCKKCYPDR
ncbi:MAG: hypothetical protein A2939_04365 [Parcubacteria group bacterium RIFCSPLOWO2_01_FULL_48_18]|nr:MAG: hypothetical protein A2939_04365 [Parcubacteria group bacterium RIFCSPLOWO2_01_FULL_48_18]